MARPIPHFAHRFVPARHESGTVLVMLHASDDDESAMLPLAALLAPGAAVLSPRGKVSEAGRPRYFRRLSQSIFDLEDLRFRARELASFIRSAGRIYSFDPARAIAVGLGNGATIAAAAMFMEPALFGGAILFRPMLPFEPDPRPDFAAKPVLVAGARDDLRISNEETEALASLLAASGAVVERFWHAGGHALSDPDVEAACQWMRRNALPPEPLIELASAGA